MEVIRAGMTLEARRRLRQQIEDDLVAQAKVQAGDAHRSMACREGNRMARTGGRWTDDQIRAAHARCQAEASGGGCLDECHDPAAPAGEAPAGT